MNKKFLLSVPFAITAAAFPKAPGKQKVPPTEEQINKWVGDAIIGGATISNDLMEARKEFTCFNCKDKDTCEYSWDAYNTGGDCLASK